MGPFVLPLIGPVGQKDHSFLPLSIVHDEGSMYSPYDPTQSLDSIQSAGHPLLAAKILRQVTRKIILQIML